MPRVLFWNVQRKQLDGLVLPLVLETQPDLLVLVEYPSVSALPQLLQSEGTREAELARGSECLLVG